MEREWKKFNAFIITLFHIVAVYSIYHVAVYSKSFILNLLFIYVVGLFAGFGVTAGVHRLWCHRTYTAKTPFRIFLALCFSIAGQNTIPQWVIDHRVHHKFSDTDADPHNANLGFWFSHMGWLYMKKHSKVIEQGRKIDMSDVLDDPVVYWHTIFFIPLKVLMCFAIPTILHYHILGDDIVVAVMAQCFFRYAMTLNITWLVNSAAHIYGDRPFDKNIFPRENKLVSMLAIGEGWHNYHHVFPNDYKAAELGSDYNFTRVLLEFAAKMGWIYNLKQPSKELVEQVIQRRGDPTYQLQHPY